MQERGGGRLRDGGRLVLERVRPDRGRARFHAGRASVDTVDSQPPPPQPQTAVSSSGDSCALGGTLSLTRLRTRGRMGVTGRKHPIFGSPVLVRHAAPREKEAFG